MQSDEAFRLFLDTMKPWRLRMDNARMAFYFGDMTRMDFLKIVREYNAFERGQKHLYDRRVEEYLYEQWKGVKQ